MSPCALIVGHAGQDGVLLKRFLTAKGYTVLGLGRDDLDIASFDSVRTYIAQYRPQEIYFLAAHHHSSEDLQKTELNEISFMSVNYTSAVNFLRALDVLKLPSRFFYASSSHIFSSKNHSPQTENSLIEAEGLYAKSKILAMNECRRYRTEKDIFASVGILYNHESYLRKNNFVSKKITSFVANLSSGGNGILELADLDAVVDWGDAEDFVEAFWRILQLPEADDFIVATGIPHTIRDFAEYAFQSNGFDYRKYVQIKPQNKIAPNTFLRVGDSSKLRKATQWRPTTSFERMIDKMIQAEKLLK